MIVSRILNMYRDACSTQEIQPLVADLSRSREPGRLIPVLAAVIAKTRNRLGIVDACADAGGVKGGHDVVTAPPQLALQNDAQTVMTASCVGMRGVQNPSILA